MKLSVITLSWDNLDYTKAFVKSIRSHTTLSYELIIVDNGSKQETQKWVKGNADNSIIFQNNQGFSRGFNEGLKIAQGKYVMMANNDTEFPPNWDIKLIETMTANPKAGIISPVRMGKVVSGGTYISLILCTCVLPCSFPWMYVCTSIIK